jgi:hypothetical protein
MRFDRNDLATAADKLKTIPYYPTDAGAQAAICEFLAKICPHRAALLWVVDRLCESARAWPGLAEVRGLLCWKFRPADGIEADCSVPGFGPEDGERISIERAGRDFPVLPRGTASDCAQLDGMLAHLVERKRLPAGCCNALTGRRTDGSFCDCRVGALARQVAERQLADRQAAEVAPTGEQAR